MPRSLFWLLTACGGAPPAAPPAVPPEAAPAAEIAPTASATAATEATPRCGPDVVAFPTWQGEYPGPIVSVKAEVEVPSYKNPCDAVPSGACKLPVGVAHPWAQPSLADRFATVRSIERYTSPIDQAIPDSEPPTSVKAGEAIEVHGYLGEGWCSLSIAGKDVTAYCPGMGDVPYTPVNGTKIPERSLFLAKSCDAWVLADAALFDRAEVDEGTLVEYGKVGP